MQGNLILIFLTTLKKHSVIHLYRHQLNQDSIKQTMSFDGSAIVGNTVSDCSRKSDALVFSPPITHGDILGISQARHVMAYEHISNIHQQRRLSPLRQPTQMEHGLVGSRKYHSDL